MDAQGRVKYLREKVKKQLQEWMPDNEALVAKELAIFDRLMTRREFLQATSLTAISALFFGCFRSRTPSQVADEVLSDAEKASVTKASKIVIDSDMLDSYGKYKPLATKSSSDASYVKANAVLESFNPHLMTTTTPANETISGFKPLVRNYGVSEIVHLNKADAASNYFFAIYEKDFTKAQQGFNERLIELEGTQDLNFNALVAANGSYHNRVKDKSVYSQKMAFATNMNDLTHPDLRLYYQTMASPILQAGAAVPQNAEWKSLDLINLFKAYEQQYTFSKYTVVDAQAYEDGSNNNFIYGTICFDDLYNYGFVISFVNIDDTEPTVSFFTPKYLSRASSLLSDLQQQFNDLAIESDTSFKDFALVAGQRFIPFVNLQNEVLFSFVGVDTTADEDHTDVYPEDDGSYDLSYFSDVTTPMIKRYLVSVDVKSGGVSYLLESYAPAAASITVDSSATFIYSFDTSNLNSFDLWTLFKDDSISSSMATVMFKDMFIRYTKEDQDSIHIMFASSFFNISDAGVIHKSVKLSYGQNETLKSDFVLDEHLTSKALFDASSFDDKEYKTMWFNEMRNTSPYNSLAACINGNDGYYQFYATHNHQGLLNSYFVIQVGESRFLINFNEQGKNPDPASGEDIYNSQDFDSLYTQIKTDAALHFPPLPIYANVQEILKFRSVGEEEEVLFSAMRPYSINKETKELLENDDETIYSYFHSNLDSIDGGWSSHEIEHNEAYDQTEKNIYKIPRHQVHLHTNNIYNTSVKVEDDVYIEVRFGSAVIVTDHTDPSKPRTFHARRQSSLFLKPKEGTVTLEVNSGMDNDDRFNGAIMFYRYASMKDFEVQKDQPVAVLKQSATATTEFLQCNISFKQFQRLTTDNADDFQDGMRSDEVPDAETASHIFHQHIKSSYEDDIKKVTDFYQKIYESAAPDNDAVMIVQNEMISQNSLCIEPLFYFSALKEVGGNNNLQKCCSAISKWVHKALSTIKHSIHHAEKILREYVKNALENLVEDIDKLSNDLTQSLHSILTSLMVIINKIMEFSKKLFILYFEPFLLFIRGFIGRQTAWDVGQEFRQLKFDQLSPDSTVTDNFYTILHDETGKLEKDVTNIANTFKTKIDDAISSSLDIGAMHFDVHSTHGKNIHTARQKNSTKFNHILHQTRRVHQQIDAPNPSDNSSVDPNAFVCDSSDTVEQLIKCVVTKEVNEISKEISQDLKDGQKVLYDVLYGNGMEASKKDLAKLLKNITNSTIDEMETITKGILQLPLAFLNGSTTLDTANKALDDSMSEVFKILGVIIFQDQDKFTTTEDVGYFFAGMEVYLFLSFIDDLKTVVGAKSDIVGYIKNGDLRNGINQTSSLEDNENFVELLQICQVIDGILIVSIAGIDYFTTASDILTFEIMRKILVPYMIFMRIICNVPVVVKHTQSTTTIYSDNNQLYRTLALTGDVFHTITLILQMFQQITYKYVYIADGTSGIYDIVTVLHIFSAIYENGSYCISVTGIPKDYFGNETQRKKDAEITKKLIAVVGSVFAAYTDILSFNSVPENSTPELIAANYISVGGVIICGGTAIVISAVTD